MLFPSDALLDGVCYFFSLSAFSKQLLLVRTVSRSRGPI